MQLGEWRHGGIKLGREEESEKLDGIRDVFGEGRGYPDTVALVVVQGGTNVPAIDAMRCPSVSLIGFFMYDDAGAWGGGGGRVVCS